MLGLESVQPGVGSAVPALRGHSVPAFTGGAQLWQPRSGKSWEMRKRCLLPIFPHSESVRRGGESQRSRSLSPQQALLGTSLQ